MDCGYKPMDLDEDFLPLKAAPDGLGAQVQKKKTMGSHINRDAQFKRIGKLKRKYEKASNPVISIDTKKKELLGDFYRSGKLECQTTILVNDHDFASEATGKLIPHGI